MDTEHYPLPSWAKSCVGNYYRQSVSGVYSDWMNESFFCLWLYCIVLCFLEQAAAACSPGRAEQDSAESAPVLTKQLAPWRTNRGLLEEPRGRWMGQRPHKPQESWVWHGRATAARATPASCASFTLVKRDRGSAGFCVNSRLIHLISVAPFLYIISGTSHSLRVWRTPELDTPSFHLFFFSSVYFYFIGQCCIALL